MEDDDNRTYAAVVGLALAAVIGVAYHYSGGTASRSAFTSPGWSSRLSSFGLGPAPEPATASGPAPSAAPTHELAPPEPVMTNAMTRQFSNPSSGGASGGLAGAASAGSADAPASMNPTHLSGGGGVDLPGGGRAPTAGPFASAVAPPRAGRTTSSSASSPARSAPVASAGGGGTVGGGDASAAAHAASSFNGAANTTASAGGAARPNAGPPPAASPGAAASGAGPNLNAAAPSAGSGGGGGGGGGGDAGGGGGGSGGGIGGGGGVDAKPKESAGPPGGGAPGGAPESASGGAAPAAPTASIPAATPASVSPVTPGSGTPLIAAPIQTGDIDVPPAVIGAPQVGTVTVRGGMFKAKPNGPTDVPTIVHMTPTGAKLVDFTSKMSIDADGAGEAWKTDRTGRPGTALQYKGGVSLDPRAIPFIVVPLDFGATHPEVKLGDYAAVSYGAKTVYAIVGDKGPAGVVGEGSMALALGLGINPDPNTGGISRRDVRYVILAGSAGETPRSGGAIQSRGKALFDAAGAPVR